MFKLAKRMLGATVAVAGAFLATSYSYDNAINVVRTDYDIYTDKVNRTYTLLFISDIHYGHMQPKSVLQRMLPELQEIHPQVVLLGGDITMEGTSEHDLYEVYELLGSIPSTWGTFYVSGNHDVPRLDSNYLYSNEELTDAITKNNIHILNEQSYRICGDLLLIGRSCMSDCGSHTTPVTKFAQEDDIANNYTVCLNHVPVDMESNAKCGVDLQLSGHTHAGQVFPVNAIVSSWGYPVYGERMYDKMKLIVTSGFGVGKVPFRNLEHCEYVVVTIHPIGKKES